MIEEKWITQVASYCQKYNIPLEYLADIISEPKVIPMIRGKAFEFSAMLRLQEVLPVSNWTVDKPVMNAQFGFHDMDVRVRHRASKKIIGIECKLAGKGSFRVLKNGDVTIRVKCMRSRTLGENKATQLAAQLGLDSQLLKVHNDQYLPTDFEVVITTIANAFYETDEETDFFEWQPSDNATLFLSTLFSTLNQEELQSLAYNKMYLASAQSLAVKTGNDVKCARKTCPSPNDCGFIPNYPLIHFAESSINPSKPWYDIEDAEAFLLQFITA